MATEFELAEWFKDGECGIAAVCGPISGNLLVIDIDYQAKENLEQLFSDLPVLMARMVIVQTPRPGIQLWFRQPSSPPSGRVLAYTEPLPVDGQTGDDGKPVMQPRGMIETRGTGNYVCVPGTPPETHPTGKPYVFIQGDHASIPTLTADEAQELLGTCRSYSKYTPQYVQRQLGDKYAGEPRPGDIYNQVANFQQLMLDAGWTVHHCEQDVTYLTRPGEKETPGHSASLGHLRSDDGKPLLHVFSTAAAPFEPNATYDCFGAYTLLHHGGDFGNAATHVRLDYAQQLQDAQSAFHAEVRQRFEQQATGELEYKPFPLESLDDVLAAYVQEHANAIDIDAAYIAAPMLAVLAGLIGPSRQIQLKRSWIEPAILWVCTIGKPSSGKSPGWEAAMAPAEAVQRSLHLANKQSQESYRQALDAYKESKRGGTDASEPEKPGPAKQLIVDDITMESLARVHQHNDRLILACEELAAWVNGMDQYRGGKGRDSQGWLRMYGGGSLNVNRVADDFSLFIPRSSVSVTGTIQPGIAAETLFAERNRHSGFAYRILAVTPPGHVLGWSDSEPPQQVIQDMMALAQQLYGLQQETCGEGTRPLALSCSDAARQVFQRFVGQTKELAEAASDDGESRWVKLRAVAARFALVLSIVKQLLHQPESQAMQPIDAEAMQAGIRLALWFGHEMERSWLSVSAGDTELMDHFDWICSRHPGGLDARTFQQGRRKVQTADDARRWLQLMARTGLGHSENGRFIPIQFPNFVESLADSRGS